MSEVLRMSTGRLRHLLQDIARRHLDVQLFPAQDVPGPGGGIYITRQTPLTTHHLAWLEQRNPAADGITYVDVRWDRAAGSAAPADIELRGEDPAAGAGRQERAETHSRRVAGAAREVADRATAIYRTLGKAEFTVADLRRAEVEASVRQFERSFHEFHGSVKKALDEYLHGNTLVMDLILRYQLDRDTVRHALSVAAFATEMATQLALRQGAGGDLGSYFGEATDADLRHELGLSLEEMQLLDEAEKQAHHLQLFREELVEIFLGGFMHDCGLWTEPFCLPEGHEVKGAKLISETREVQQMAPALAKIVLFHSDVIRLARKHGLVKITDNAEDLSRLNFRREFYDQRADALAAAELYGGGQGEVLSLADLRKILPVALAEYYISHTRDVYTKSEAEVINDLTPHVRGGPFERYMVVLCNSRVDVVAPRRALVSLAGYLSVMVEDRRESRRAVRLEVDGFDAGSLHHGRGRNSPHLITLFLRRGDGSRAKAEYVHPREAALWDRAAGVGSRMYIAAGRYRNNLSYRVTGFMSEEVFARVLGEYEQELQRRL